MIEKVRYNKDFHISNNKIDNIELTLRDNAYQGRLISRDKKQMITGREIEDFFSEHTNDKKCDVNKEKFKELKVTNENSGKCKVKTLQKNPLIQPKKTKLLIFNLII